MEKIESKGPYQDEIKIALIIIAGLLLVLGVFFTISAIKKHSANKNISVGIESSLAQVINVNELHTIEYTYNSFAIAYETRFSMEEWDRYHSISYIISADKNQLKKLDFESFEKLREEKILETSKKKEIFDTVNSFSDLTNQIESNSGDYEIKATIIRECGLESNENRSANDIFIDKKIKNQLIYDFYTLCTDIYDFEDLERFISLKRKAAITSMKKEQYAVAYKGLVRIGINNDEIEIKKDDDSEKIIIIIPKAIILEPVVTIPPDEENKSIIEINGKKSNIPNWERAAYKICKADLEKKLKRDTEFIKLGTENAIETVRLLVKPFETANFKIEVKAVEELND